jgi:hypothetical protein
MNESDETIDWYAGKHKKEELPINHQSELKEESKLSNEEKVEEELSKFDSNIVSLKNELSGVGGEDGIEKTWSALDVQKKDEIIARMKKYSEGRKTGIEIQETGDMFLDPRDLGFGDWKKGGDPLGRISGPASYLTGIFPLTGIALKALGSIPTVYNSLKLKIEENRLARLEKLQKN